MRINRRGRIISPLAWVHDRIFAAGGSHIPSNWESFRNQMGISAILNINETGPTSFIGRPPERYLWLNIVDEKEAGFEARTLAGWFLHDCVLLRERVLIHSMHGRHRTRWAYVAFLLYSGESVGSALRQAAETPWLAPYPTDRERWHAFAQQLDSSSIGPAA